jgi:hypothetical protein
MVAPGIWKTRQNQDALESGCISAVGTRKHRLPSMARALRFHISCHGQIYVPIMTEGTLMNLFAWRMSSM